MFDLEAPSLQQLQRDWNRWRGTQEFPARRQFEAFDLKYILGNLSLVDVLHDPRRYRYRIYGSNFSARVGFDMTGKFLDDLPDHEHRTMARLHFDQAVDERRPVVKQHEHWFSDRRLWNCEILVLPLADDGTTINMMMVGVEWVEGTRG